MVQDLLPAGALVVGDPDDFAIRQPGIAEAVIEWPVSAGPRGLALRKLTIERGWDKVLWMFETDNEIFYTSLAFDMSGEQPFLLPPKTFTAEEAVFKMRKGDTIEFTLGEGEPIFPPRVVRGGISVFIMVWEADAASRKLGETISQMHADLTADGSVMAKLKSLITNPGSTIADEILSVRTSALKPLATLLKQNGNDFVAPFRGFYKSQGSWEKKLAASANGVRIELAEVD